MNTESNANKNESSSVPTVDEAVKTPKVTRRKRKPRLPMTPARSKTLTPMRGSIHKKTNPLTKHPNYRSMVTAAIKGKRSRKGVSFRAIINYINESYAVNRYPKFVSAQVKQTLTKIVDDGLAVLVSGTVGTGYFKLNSSSKKSRSKSDNNDVEARKMDEELALTDDDECGSNMNSTFTKIPSAGTSKSLTKGESSKVVKTKLKSTLTKTKVVVAKRNSSSSKQLSKRNSISNKRKFIGKVSTKKPSIKTPKPKKHNIKTPKPKRSVKKQ